MRIRSLCLLAPCLTLLITPDVLAATSADSGEPIVVSASRSYRTVSEMAQTTWVIDNADIAQQAEGGKELKDILAQLIPDECQRPGADKLRHEYARALYDCDGGRCAPEFITQ